MIKGSITYTRELADLICERLASGESLTAICRDAHMPNETAVRKWALKDHDGFSLRYARARELQLEHLADEILEISDDGRNDWMERGGFEVPNGEHIQRSKLRSDNRKWLLSKLKPERYGDRMEHVGAGGSPLIPERSSDSTRLAEALLTVLALPAAASRAHARIEDSRVTDAEIEGSDGADD
jgi:hypothetical protein